MIPFLLYIARSSLYLALFYAFFLLVMRRTTFFRLNRIILLGGTLACFLLPVLRLRRAGAAFWTVGAPQIIGMAEAPAGGTAAAGGHPYHQGGGGRLGRAGSLHFPPLLLSVPENRRDRGRNGCEALRRAEPSLPRPGEAQKNLSGKGALL